MNTPKKREVRTIKEKYDAIKAVESGIIIIVNIITTLFSVQCISYFHSPIWAVPIVELDFVLLVVPRIPMSAQKM